MDKIKNTDSYGLKRLESKNAKNAIIQKLSQDFNLTPIIAEAFNHKSLFILTNTLTSLFLPVKFPTKLFVQLNRLVSISDLLEK
jgi:hypothetical protein